jgi:hypothetical protein
MFVKDLKFCINVVFTFKCLIYDFQDVTYNIFCHICIEYFVIYIFSFCTFVIKYNSVYTILLYTSFIAVPFLVLSVKTKIY